jgi:hypothetical protein
MATAVEFLGAVALLLSAATTAQAAAYVEDFEAPFPAWEQGWFGQYSDAANLYCNRPCDFRGNNPDGLWLQAVTGVGDGYQPIEVRFDPVFGAAAGFLAMDVAAYTGTTLRIYDSADVLIFEQDVALTYGAWTDPGDYVRYEIASTTGIGRFSFDRGASGNTSIDNLLLRTAPIPEPATALLMLAGAAGLALLRRRARLQPAR